MNGRERFVRVPSALWRRVGGEVLVARPDDGDVAGLSTPGSMAWLLLRAPRSLDELTASLASELGQAAEEIRAQVEDLVRELVRRGWVERSVTDA